jgi:GntR family transcriptional regulator
MASSTRSHQAGLTRYREIERYLRAQVEGAPPGAPLPSEAELCERFSVSRMTVRQALQELTNDGLVERRGVQATSRLLSAGMDEPRRPEAIDLGLAPDSQVVRIVRVRLADGVPVALEDAALVPELRDVLEEDLGGGSLHDALERRGVVATRATGTITARLARASETELLDLGPQSALLVELRVLFDQEGRVFERTETRYVADRYVIDVVHTHP